jgi:peptide/nickel transport system substrate-binding protein
MEIRRPVFLLVLALLTAACAPSVPGTNSSGGGGNVPASAAPKRISIAMFGELTNVRSQVMTVTPGLTEVEQMINAGLAAIDDKGIMHPRLAEAVPSIENGLWKVFPDGRMETTWKIMPNAKWHDGVPFTAEDVYFTVMQVGKDPETSPLRHLMYDYIDAIDMPDDHTAVVRWNKPNIDADRLLSTVGDPWPMPLPKHALERIFNEDKMNFLDSPYFSRDFVGTGPYRIRDWMIGSQVVLEANPDYVLGRPRIDEIEVKFILDLNTMVANIAAGSVDANVGRGVSLEQALDIRGMWPGGRLDIPPRNIVVIYPQLINPTQPAVMTDLRFRRAALHAIDRQAMVDTIMRGQSSIAHVFLNPNEPEYREIEPSIVKYDYDPRLAMQLIEQLGYTKGADGMYQQGGQPLSVHFQSTVLDVHQKSLLAVTDYLKQVGMVSEIEVLTPQRVDDRGYRAQRPGFELTRTANALSAYLSRNHGSQTPLPEDNFRRYTNKSRYMNAEYDGLIDRYFATVPWQERVGVLGQIMQHTTENLIVMGLFYDVEPMAVANRLTGVEMRKAELSSPIFNVHEWDLKG